MKLSPRLALIPLIVAVALLGAGVATLLTRQTPAPPPPQTSLIGGPFTMTADDGRSVTDRDFKGHPFLVYFGYTHCPDVCPTALLDISQVLKALGPDAKIKVLFVTVDPARDTPKIMKAYLANFDPRIVGLSGTEAQTKAIEHVYRAYAKKVPGKNGDYTMDHTAIFYLMDKEGRFVSTFRTDRPVKAGASELQEYL